MCQSFFLRNERGVKWEAFDIVVDQIVVIEPKH